MKQQLLRIAGWASQTINVWLLLGHHDQTVSARCHVNRHLKRWNLARKAINATFFWQEDHCRASYLRDVQWAKEILDD